jgi:hypothetical protein
MTAPGISEQVYKAINTALRLIGHRPDRYDADAVIGSLMSEGIHVMSSDDVNRAMFDDRCDYECATCHPEDDE